MHTTVRARTMSVAPRAASRSLFTSGMTTAHGEASGGVSAGSRDTGPADRILNLRPLDSNCGNAITRVGGVRRQCSAGRGVHKAQVSSLCTMCGAKCSQNRRPPRLTHVGRCMPGPWLALRAPSGCSSNTAAGS